MSERPAVHEAAARGFDVAAGVYERSRPGYPTDALDFVVESLALRAGELVLDVAAGTGKFTALLSERGLRCVAVEPVGGMREAFRGALRTELVAATAEHLPFAAGVAAGVTVAQAFHWFNADRALAEMHRVLQPGRCAAMIWNVRDDRVGWVARLTDLLDVYAAGVVQVPRHRDEGWRPALDGFAGLRHVEERRFPYEHLTTPEGLVERVASASFIASLPDHERMHALEQVRALAEHHEELAGRDSFPFPYVTEVHILQREP